VTAEDHCSAMFNFRLVLNIQFQLFAFITSFPSVKIEKIMCGNIGYIRGHPSKTS